MNAQNRYVPRLEPRRESHQIRGVDYNVWRWGVACSPRMFFLHGWRDVGASFQFVVDALQRDWDVIAPDLRGFGRSTTEASAYWFPDYLADLDQLLSIYSRSEPAFLVGHSMGANVAGLYAGTMPERVAAFVNVEGFGLDDSDPADAPGRFRSWIEEGRATPRFSAIESYESLARRIQRRSPRMSDECANYVARLWARPVDRGLELLADPRHKLPNAVLYRRAEAEACWRQVTAPVLLVSGTGGRIGDGHGLPFPNRRSVRIDDAGHMIHFEAPGALAAHIEAFLTEYL